MTGPEACRGRPGRTAGRADWRTGSPVRPPTTAERALRALGPAVRPSARPPPSWLHRQLGLPLGHDAQHYPVGAGEVGLHGALYRRGRHLPVAVEVLLEIVRGPDEVVVIVQLIGLAAKPAHALHPGQELRFDGVLRPLHLARRRAL